MPIRYSSNRRGHNKAGPIHFVAHNIPASDWVKSHVEDGSKNFCYFFVIYVSYSLVVSADKENEDSL